MKLKLFNMEGAEKGSVALPAQFSEEVRKDLIKRAVLALQANSRQKYGAYPEAGKGYSAYVSKRRRAYKGTYGIGQSRTPRKVLTRRGTQFYHVGAFAPQTVGGRRAHPPKASKNWEQKVNEKENQKAIRSALSATIIKELVLSRGHKAPEAYPFIISDEFESIKKASELRKALKKLGFKEELERASKKKIRPGKGKSRGRKHKTKTSILFVVKEEKGLEKAIGSFPGITIAKIEGVNAEMLAPGAQPGRLTLYTESAIKKLGEEKLFTKEYKAPERTVKKKEEKLEAKKEPVKKAVKKKTAKKAVKSEK